MHCTLALQAITIANHELEVPHGHPSFIADQLSFQVCRRIRCNSGCNSKTQNDHMRLLGGGGSGGGCVRGGWGGGWGAGGA